MTLISFSIRETIILKLSNAKLTGGPKQPSEMGYYENAGPTSLGIPPKQGVKDTSKGPDKYGTPRAMKTDKPFATMDPNKDVTGGM